MGDESAALSGIEVPNENIPEPLGRPSGGRSQGPGGIHPEVLRDIKHERGGILTRSTTDPEIALRLKIRRLECAVCLLKHSPGKVRENRE